MEASAYGLTYAPSAGATAWIDPAFQLAPGVDPGAYSFVFSSGIGNTAPVPEPEAYAMMLSGLAVLGWVSMRRLI